MSFVKKALLRFCCSAAVGVIWFVISNVLPYMDNASFVTAAVFAASSASMSVILAKGEFPKEESIFKKIGYSFLTNIFSIAVMYGAFFAAFAIAVIFIGH